MFISNRGCLNSAEHLIALMMVFSGFYLLLIFGSTFVAFDLGLDALAALITFLLNFVVVVVFFTSIAMLWRYIKLLAILKDTISDIDPDDFADHAVAASKPTTTNTVESQFTTPVWPQESSQ